MKSNELRKRFIDFFESRKHTFVPSSSMVIKNDPTLLFVNAGMNQFKDVFLGNKESKIDAAVNSQKCLRVSGKHNDLDEVGHDTYHHTMFEMLGNWSFGSYFKKDAIMLAWEFLVKDLKISEDRLYVTFFEGDEKENLESDNETKHIWSQITSDEKIVAGSKKDNFWEMGKIGPCGPSTEIHIDLREDNELIDTPTVDLINKDHPQVIEIWNLVFIEFNRNETGELTFLPKKHVDTGMGFERLCMVMQNKKSTYDTDIFFDLIQGISSISDVNYGNSIQSDIAIRVIVDHVRAISFSIADGQLPSNNGAGYVVRRILRRAVRYGYTYLNLKQPFLYKLVDILSKNFKSIFPEINLQKSTIKTVIKEEENMFLKTLGKGLDLINRSIEALPKDVQTMSGSDVFVLYDTYGFPPDLTELILREKNLYYDKIQFDKDMLSQKSRSRSASKIIFGDWVIVNNLPFEGFVGYQNLEISDAQLVRYRKVRKKDKDYYHLVFNKTPFYPEGGGQVGDNGIISHTGTKNATTVDIIDTKKENNLIVHLVKDLPFNLKDNNCQNFNLRVNKKRRLLTARNHSATHLLHFHLRHLLGLHIEQKGSFVGPDYLRFDFSHFQKIDSDTLSLIEHHINSSIINSEKIEEFNDMAIDNAKEMGAISLFGEKYGDYVRVIKLGDSIELCGGTHVSATSEIGLFKIISESSISAGVRRIEARTSLAAIKLFDNYSSTLKDLEEMLKQPQNLIKSVQKVLTENKELNELAASFKRDKYDILTKELSSKMLIYSDVKYLISDLSIDVSAMKNICFSLIKEHDNAFLVFTINNNNKIIINVAISKKLVEEKNLNASKIVNEIGSHVNARGGGQPFFAVASGNKVAGLNALLDHAKEIIQNL